MSTRCESIQEMAPIVNCECPICKEPAVVCQTARTTQDISATGCGHTFHALCLRQWLAISKTCPKCRFPVKDGHTINKLYFDPVSIPTHRDPGTIEYDIEYLKAKVAVRDGEIDSLKKSVADSRYRLQGATIRVHFLEMDVDVLKHRNYICENQQMKFQRELSAVEEELDESESQRKSLEITLSAVQEKMVLARHKLRDVEVAHSELKTEMETQRKSMEAKLRLELETSYIRHLTVTRSSYKETSCWKTVAASQTKETIDLELAISEWEECALDWEKAIAEWVQTRAQLPPEVFARFGSQTVYGWDTHMLEVTVKRLQSEVNILKENRKLLLGNRE